MDYHSDPVPVTQSFFMDNSLITEAQQGMGHNVKMIEDSLVKKRGGGHERNVKALREELLTNETQGASNIEITNFLERNPRIVRSEMERISPQMAHRVFPKCSPSFDVRITAKVWQNIQPPDYHQCFQGSRYLKTKKGVRTFNRGRREWLKSMLDEAAIPKDVTAGAAWVSKDYKVKPCAPRGSFLAARALCSIFGCPVRIRISSPTEATLPPNPEVGSSDEIVLIAEGKIEVEALGKFNERAKKKDEPPKTKQKLFVPADHHDHRGLFLSDETMAILINERNQEREGWGSCVGETPPFPQHSYIHPDQEEEDGVEDKPLTGRKRGRNAGKKGSRGETRSARSRSDRLQKIKRSLEPSSFLPQPPPPHPYHEHQQQSQSMEQHRGSQQVPQAGPGPQHLQLSEHDQQLVFPSAQNGEVQLRYDYSNLVQDQSGGYPSEPTPVVCSQHSLQISSIHDNYGVPETSMQDHMTLSQQNGDAQNTNNVALEPSASGLDPIEVIYQDPLKFWSSLDNIKLLPTVLDYVRDTMTNRFRNVPKNLQLAEHLSGLVRETGMLESLKETLAGRRNRDAAQVVQDAVIMEEEQRVMEEKQRKLLELKRRMQEKERVQLEGMERVEVLDHLLNRIEDHS